MAAAALGALLLAACAEDEPATDPAPTSASAPTAATTARSPVTTGPSTTAGAIATTPTTMAQPTTAAPAPPPTPGATVDAGAPAYCAEMRDLAAYNSEAGELDTETPWPELQRQIVTFGEAAVPLYDSAIDIAPGDVRDALRTLADFSAATREAAEQASSFEDYVARSQALPAVGVAEAQVEFNDFIIVTCGFGPTE